MLLPIEIKIMRIYIIPYALIDEEPEREIKKKTFGLEPIDAPNFWYLHGALQHKFIFDKANMYVDCDTYKSNIVEVKDEKNILLLEFMMLKLKAMTNLAKHLCGNLKMENYFKD